MEFSQAIDRVLKEQFTGYIAHGFKTLGGQEPDEWQIGVYDTDTDRVQVFTVTDDAITASEPQEVYKDGGIVPELDLASITKPPSAAVGVAHDMLRSDYPGNPIMKTMVIVQTLDERPVYNITTITGSFNMLNTKICADTLEILSSSFDSVMSLRKDD